MTHPTFDAVEFFDLTVGAFDLYRTPALPMHYVLQPHRSTWAWLIPATLAGQAAWDARKPYRGHYQLEAVPEHVRRLYRTA